MAWHWRALKWLGFGSLGFALLVVAVVGGGLVWGMVQYSRAHPLNLMPYLPRLQAVLEPYGLHLNVSGAQIFFEDSPVIRVSDLTLAGADGKLAVVAEKMAVKLANRRLFLLQASPKIIEAEGTTLRIVNTADGLKIAGLTTRAPKTGAGAPAGVLAWLNSIDASALWGRMKNIKVAGLTLLVEDQVNNASWVLEEGALALTRYPNDGERGSLTGQVRRLNGPVRADGTVAIVPVLLRFDHPAGAETATLRGRLDQADINMVTDYLPPQLRELLKAQGEVEMGTDLLPGNRLGQPWVTLRMGQVNIQPPAGFSKPLVFQKLAITASYVPPVEGVSPSDVLTLHAVDATTARGNQFLASGSIRNLTTDPLIALSLASSGGDVQGIFDFFPDQPHGFATALAFLRPNIVSATYANLRGHYVGRPSAFPHCGDACGDVAIDAFVNGGTVHFLPGMSPAVLASSGTFVWRGQHFTVAAPLATVGEQEATSVTVQLTNLFSASPTHVLVGGVIRGPLKDVMAQLHRVDKMVPADMEGRQSSLLHVDVPFHAHVSTTFAMTTVTVSGTVKQASIRGVEGLGGDTFQTPLAVVTLDAAKNLRVQAQGQLVKPGGKVAATTKADVVVNIQPGLPTPVQISLDGNMDGAFLWARLGKPAGVVLNGPLNVAANLVESPSGSIRFGVRADATGARVTLPDLNFTKPGKESLLLEAQGTYIPPGSKQAEKMDLTRLRLTGKNANVAGTANITLSQLDDMSLALSPFHLGQTDAAVSIANRTAAIKGKMLDLRGIDLFPADDEPSRIRNMALSLSLGTLATEKGLFTGVEGALKATRGKWDVASFRAKVEGGGTMSLKTTTLGGGRKKVSINMDDAGRALSGLGLYDKLLKGRLWGDILYDTPRTATGLIKVQDFELKNPPILMSLLGLMSLQQLVAGTDSTLFDHAEIPLKINGDVVTLTKANLEGPSMSIRLDGTYNRDTAEMNFDGRLAPAIPFNRLVTKIPLVGTLLAGSQNGVVVADFKLKGPSKNPDIHVRPLSVLTPGLVKDVWRGLTDAVSGPSDNTSPTKGKSKP